MKRKSRLSGIREEILKEWRGCDEATDLTQGIHQAEDFINAVLKSAGAQDGLREDEVKSTWKELAGEFISQHTEPVSVKNGNLVLRVNQPTMRFHLDQMKPMLLKRLQEQLGKDRIKVIKFNIG